MELKKSAWLYHILIWMVLYIIWVLLFRTYSIRLSQTFSIEFCYLIFVIIDYYTVVNLLIPQFLKGRNHNLFPLLVLALIGISGFLRALLAKNIMASFFHYTTLPPFKTLWVDSSLFITLWVLLLVLVNILWERNRREKEISLIEKEKIKAELDFLKAQINPHSLFNSLNTIYGYIDKTNIIARNILVQFSELLRYQLYDCNAEKVDLQKEIEYIRNYIRFQMIRIPENLLVKIEIETIPSGYFIAPLLLMVPLENAFKFVGHGSEKTNEIIIQIYIRDHQLYSRISNTLPLGFEYSNNKPNGIGISNLKRRLELLYPDQFSLDYGFENGWFISRLKLNMV